MASRELSILVVAKNLASGALQAVRNDLKGIESQAGRSSAAANTLSGRALGGLKSAASGASGAFGVLKGRIGQLAGTAGLVGLGAGLFSVVGFLGESISTAKSFGDEVYKLQAVTGLSTQKTSELAGAFHHFGIESETALKIAGFAEKNLFLQGDTAKKATAFYKLYGLQLRDSAGRLKDFNTLLLDSADYFNNKQIPAAEKAAGLAKIYGRNWSELVPVFQAGRVAIAGAEEEAKKLGLTLTGKNVDQLTKLREATRSWGTALAGLKLQIGLAAVPAITELATSLTSFLASSSGGTTGTQKIVGFFKDILNFARQAGSAFTHYFVPAFQGVLAAFNTIPKPLRDLLLTGFAVNKSVKFLFGFSPLKLVESGIGALFKGGIFARGSFVNPMFVKDVAGGLGGGKLPLKIPPVGEIAGGLTAAGFATAAGAGALAALPLAGGLLVSGNVAEKFGNLNNTLKAVGLSTREIGAAKFAAGGEAFQQASIKHGFDYSPADQQAATKKLADLGYKLDQGTDVLKLIRTSSAGVIVAVHATSAASLGATARAASQMVAAGLHGSLAGASATVRGIAPHLRRIEGADLATSTKVGTLRAAVNATTGAARALQPHLRNIAGADARTAISTGIISRKNFAPRVNVNVNAQVALSVNSVARSLTDMHISSGIGGTGGFIQ